MKPAILCLFTLFSLLLRAEASKQVAYIHGDVAQDGTTPSGAQPPYDQMLLTDSGSTGCSQFKTLVESQGYTITQHYDQTTSLTPQFLKSFDVIIFGLHQRVWSSDEKNNLDDWIRAGGGILIYSDSAAGGKYNVVGIKNTTGQTAVNNIITPYGMQVTVDQGGGVRSYTSPPDSTHPVIWDNPVFEGEGVSPVAVDPNGPASVLIPLDADHITAGSSLSIDARNVTISNPQWACMAHCKVGDGHIIALFDRQPMWNNGPGSDINEEDNKEILRRVVRYLANDYGNSEAWFAVTRDGLDLTYRQWTGGSGIPGSTYTAHHTRFCLQQKTNLTDAVWFNTGANLQTISRTVESGGETERVTVRIVPDSPQGFARAAMIPSSAGTGPVTAEAGMNLYIGETGYAKLEGAAQGATAFQWSKQSGPGTVTFADAAARFTTATFSQPGSYQLTLTAGNGLESASDRVTVTVIDDADVVYAVNCGNTSAENYAAHNGFTYEPDRFYANGHLDDWFAGNAVSRTDDDILYNFARSQHSAYTIPLPNGSYTVYLQFAETYWTASEKRIFSTSLEGTPVIPNLDLVDTAPGIWTAYDRAFPVAVTDGSLDITFSASVNNALLNAFVIIRN